MDGQETTEEDKSRKLPLQLDGSGEATMEETTEQHQQEHQPNQNGEPMVVDEPQQEVPVAQHAQEHQTELLPSDQPETQQGQLLPEGQGKLLTEGQAVVPHEAQKEEPQKQSEHELVLDQKLPSSDQLPPLNLPPDTSQLNPSAPHPEENHEALKKVIQEPLDSLAQNTLQEPQQPTPGPQLPKQEPQQPKQEPQQPAQEPQQSKQEPQGQTEQEPHYQPEPESHQPLEQGSRSSDGLSGNPSSDAPKLNSASLHEEQYLQPQKPPEEKPQHQPKLESQLSDQLYPNLPSHDSYLNSNRLPASESHSTSDFPPVPSSDLPPISTCQSESINSQLNSRRSNHSTPEAHHSSSTSIHDEDDSGPDYYTSGSESESESELSPKQRAKRERLRMERDKIKPSYYYGEKELEEEAIEKGIRAPKLKRKGMRGVPVFEPSMEQFRDFYSYINRIDRWGMRSGIVKIIPPKEWTEQLPHLGQESLRTDGEGQMLRNAKIKSPISQVIQGSRGLFRVMNVAKRKTYNALEWYDLANSNEHRPPDFLNKTVDLSSANFNQPHPDISNTRSTRSSRRSANSIAPFSHKISNPRRRKVSRGHSTADTPMADLSSPEKRDVQDCADCSPSKLPPVPEDKSQSCQSTGDNNTGPPNSANTAHVPQHHSPPSKPANAASDDQSRPEKSDQTENAVGTEKTEEAEKVDESENADKTKGDDEIAATCPVENDRPPEPPNPEENHISDAADQLQDIQMSNTTSNQCTPAPNELPYESDKKKPRRSIQNVPTAEEWAQFVERYEKLPYDASKSDYSFQVCREIEQEYWRTIGNGGEPMYGADTMGSLFDERTKDWNVANLDNLLNRLKLKKKIPGVNTPYLYFGTWRATFAWHVEDADLYSINYIHFGAPKFWYSIPQEHNPRFENFMSSSFAKERRTCSQFLRHKAFLASPSVLQSVGVQLNKVVHLPGEIILTYPYGYHSGFNLGYNCAESVNFANEDWIEKGRKAQSCKCIDDAVTINVDAWLEEHQALCRKEAETQERAAQKLQRQQKHEDRKRQRSGNPDDPSPTKRKKKDNSKSTTDTMEKSNDILQSGLNSLLDPSLPSLSPQIAKVPKRGRPKKKPETDADGNIISTKPSQPSEKTLKRKSSTSGPGTHSASKKTGSALAKKAFPCVLCPDTSEDGLVRIIEERPSEPLETTTPVDSPSITGDGSCPKQDPIATGSGSVPEDSKAIAIQPLKTHPPRPKPIKWAHKVCCMFTPSTWFETLPTGEEVVKGFEAIEKARWALKCQLCKEKMGTKVQCTKSQKCARACHVTCGLKTGLFFLDAKIVKGDLSYSLLDPSPGGVPPGLDVGQDPTLVVLCKQHNPIYQKAEAERKAKELADKVAQFVPGQALKVRTSQGVFQVFFHSRDENRKTLRVTFEDGHSAALPYNKVYFGSAETFAKKLQASTTNQPSSTQGLQAPSNSVPIDPTMAVAMIQNGGQPSTEGIKPMNQAGEEESHVQQNSANIGPSIHPCLSSFAHNIHPAFHTNPPASLTPDQFPGISHFDNIRKPNLSAIEAGLIDSRLL